MPSIAAVVNNIVANPRPVLCIDACAILDIVRAPIRGSSGQIEHAAALVEALLDTPPRLHLVQASVTRTEVADHLDQQVTNLEAHLRKVAEAVADTNVAFGSTKLQPLSLPTASMSALPTKLKQIAVDFMQNGIQIDHDDGLHVLAYQRVLRRRRPARHGRIKDAQMHEEYLCFCRCARASGFAPPVVFICSNPADFCRDEPKALHPDIAAEYGPVNLVFCMNWAAARAQLGL